MADQTVIEGANETPEDRIYASVMTCEPALPPMDMEDLADLVVDMPHIVRPWRLTALLASKGGEFYREVANDAGKARALASSPDILNEFAKTLRYVADLADCAAARLLVAGCNHEQFNEWAAQPVKLRVVEHLHRDRAYRKDV